MPARVIGSAPSRIDLAGGTLDIWPLSVLVPRAVTVNVAIELRATAVVAERADSRVAIVSRDRRLRVLRRLPLDQAPVRGPLPLLERLVAAFEPQRGLELTTRAEAPAGAGLGGSSTLGIAVGAALARFFGARLSAEHLLRRVMNVEAVTIGTPTGNQDSLAAIHGGLSAWHHEPDGTRHERLAIPPALARRLVLAYTGEPRASGISNWDMFRRFVDGEARTVRRMEAIARVAREMLDALRAGDLDTAGRVLGEEGRLRFGLAPTVGTPGLRRAAEAARRAGALGAKVCGAGGGGCLVALVRAGAAPAVAAAIAGTGARILDPKLARRGVVVKIETGGFSARRSGSRSSSGTARRSRSR
jgi:D-glycero-alpha-D-manno-heptose-7-phosphate kinase